MSNYNDDATVGGWSMNGSEWNAMSAVIDSKASASALSNTASVLSSSVATKLNKLATVRSVASDYTLVSTDSSVILDVSTTATVTLPNGLDTGFQAVIVNGSSAGTDTVTLIASTTLNSKDSATSLANQYGAVTVLHKGSNVWYAFGDLS